MSGFDNEVMYASGERIESSTTQAIALMQKTASDVSIINYTGNPEGLISANPASLCHVPSTGALYKKNSGTGNTGWNAIQSGNSTLTGNSGTATASSGNINVVTSNSTVKFTGSGSTLTQDFGLANLVLGDSLPSLTTGTNNVGLGQGVLNSVTGSSQNVAIGINCLSSLTSTVNSGSTGVGYNCLQSFNLSGATAVGYEAMKSSTGTENTALGYQALRSAVGNSNTAIGHISSSALAASGEQNVSVGASCLANGTTYNYCVGIGYQALVSSNGDSNTAVGRASLNQLSSGINNTCLGYNSGFNILGSNNTLIGASAHANATGSNNITIGSSAGSSCNTTESSNVLIGNAGVAAESNVIHIGTQGGGAGQQNKVYIAGITGVTVSNQAPVIIDTTTGQLGQGTAAGIFNWTDVSGTSQTIAINTGYFSDNAGTVAFTLPATAAQFSIFRIVGVQGAWTLAQAANQQIKIGNTATTVGITGSLASSNAGDCVECIAVVGGASTIWRVISMIGNITVV